MTDYAARLAELQDRETKALSAVSAAATTLTRKRERNEATRQRLAAEEADLEAALTAAQGAYAAAAGPDRAALVLGITVAAARNMAKRHEADTSQQEQHDQHQVEHQQERAS